MSMMMGVTEAKSYTGQGDIVGGAIAWWGLRAYSAATIGRAAVRIVRASDSAQQDFNTVGNGSVDISSISTFLNATTGKVVTFYDQTGNGNDLTQGTDALRPTFTLNGIGSLPCITLATGTYLVKTSFNSNTDVTQPYTIVAVADDTGTSVTGGGVIASNASGVGVAGMFSNDGSANTIDAYAGSSILVTAANNTWHVFAAVLNGASSNMNVDGSDNTGSAGTRILSKDGIYMGFDGLSSPFVGKATEGGVWASAFSSGECSSMNSNSKSYYGI